jgi:hypothetical protein
MFARWSQENFFKYAREHFALDRLADYRTEAISEPLRVVNPDYRQLDGQVRSATGKLTRRLANFAAMTLKNPSSRHMSSRSSAQGGAARGDRDAAA